MGVGTDDEERERRAGYFKRAGIPTRLWKATTKDYATKARDLFSYLGSPARAEDLGNGIGLALYGSPEVRSDVFALVAKGHAAAGQSVMLITTHALLYFMDTDADKRRELSKVKHLFLEGFEKDFAQGAECPYTYYQQIEVEEFLQSRRDAGLINNFSVHNRWTAVKWWSRDFIAATGAAVREIKL